MPVIGVTDVMPFHASSNGGSSSAAKASGATVREQAVAEINGCNTGPSFLTGKVFNFCHQREGFPPTHATVQAVGWLIAAWHICGTDLSLRSADYRRHPLQDHSHNPEAPLAPADDNPNSWGPT